MTQLGGIIPILPTPFDASGGIDEASFRRVIRYVLAAGAHGVAFPAMASEFYALTDQERLRLTDVMVDEVAGTVPVIGTASAASRQAALERAKDAHRAGVDAIMVMPPYVVRDALPAVITLFDAIASEVDLPLVLQNAPAPLGSAFPMDAVARILSACPAITHVKEEVMPCGQRMSQLMTIAPTSLHGVFGGAGGRTIIDELVRGAAGAMPACELTEVHVAIWDAFASGDEAHARTLYERSLPLLTLQATFRMDLTKRVLHRRNLIEHDHVRVGRIPFDATDEAELDAWLDRIDDLLLPNPASS